MILPCKEQQGGKEVPLTPEYATVVNVNMIAGLFFHWANRCFSALRITFAAKGGACTSEGNGMFRLSKHVLLHLTEHWKQKLLLGFIAEGAALPT